MITECHVFVAPRFDLARAVHPCRVDVQQHPNHHLLRIGRLTTTVLVLIRTVDRAPRSSADTTSTRNRARWPSGSQSRRDSGKSNDWFKASGRKLLPMNAS